MFIETQPFIPLEMSANDPFAFLAAEQPQRKSTKKPHWRDKLFSKDKSSRATQDQEIEAFLSATRPVPETNPRNLPPDLSPLPSLPNPPPITDNFAAFKFTDDLPPRKPRARARKGLRVGFTDQRPELIGEGGDDADTPTIDISRQSRGRGALKPENAPAPPSHDPSPSRPNLPNLRVNTTLGDDDRRAPRAAYALNERDGENPADWKPPLMHNPQEAEFLNSVHLVEGASRLSFRASPESSSFAERIRAQMQAEEGRALQHRYDDDIPSPGNDEEEPPSSAPPLDSPEESVYDTPRVSTSNPPSNTPSVRSVAQSIRHPSSPAVHRQAANLSPVDPRLPPNNLAPGSPGGLSPTPPKVPPHEQPAPMQPHPSSRDDREPSRSPQPPKFSLRTVANQLGDTAFVEFKDYTAQYNSLLQRTAESAKPLMETSLAEWIRASVWWFLRGKTRLETYARSWSSCPPSYAKQAVIDLGKTLWINQNFVLNHSELSRYGSMSVDALLAVVSTTGDKETADLLSLHQTILNHLRSLSISIKRNNILSVIASDDDSSSYLDTSVWLRYPFFAPDVSAVLSGAATRSMLVDKGDKVPSMTHMMPLGDTNGYFSYGSMFVQVCVSSSDDEGQQYAMPCVLTIIRERTDWYVLAAISSQSQLVNLMIQSDRKKGPTWDDVDWQIKTNSMRAKLPRGFELDVMFREDDFKTLWNIVKYTLKSEASLRPKAGESVVFENTLKVFHYMDPGTPKAFPAEPLERCRIRLFERSVTVTEGTGSRSLHQGFRLTVLTSPKVKTLSNVRHILGRGSPVVFGLLRGEGGAPALLLKVTEDGRTRSMLMTFHTVEERTQMHSVLLGMIPREGEMKTSDIPIRAYSIEQTPDPVTGRSAVTHLQFPAGNVFVIDQEHAFVDHGYGPTILSEHLRAFIATKWGSVTDRINMGPGELKMSLDVARSTGLSLYRPAQQDLTVSVADNLVRPEMPEQLTEFLEEVTAKPMIRRFDFASIQGMYPYLSLTYELLSVFQICMHSKQL